MGGTRLRTPTTVPSYSPAWPSDLRYRPTGTVPTPVSCLSTHPRSVSLTTTVTARCRVNREERTERLRERRAGNGRVGMPEQTCFFPSGWHQWRESWKGGAGETWPPNAVGGAEIYRTCTSLSVTKKNVTTDESAYTGKHTFGNKPTPFDTANKWDNNTTRHRLG
jgi:hypothetical protein